MRANENNEKMTRATSIHHVDFITRGVLQEAHPIKDLASMPKTIESSRAAREILLSIPLTAVDSKKGYLDITVNFLSRVSRDTGVNATHNILSIDPKATGLVYTFEPETITDVRSALATLPFHPTVLLPQSALTTSQYEAALRTALALAQKDLQVQFLAIPKIGEMVDSHNLTVPDALKALPYFADFYAAGMQHKALKIEKIEQVGAWLLLYSLTNQSLAHVVIDADSTAKIMRIALASLAQLDLKNYAVALQQLAITPASTTANIRVASLAGQPVLLLDEPNMSVAANMLTTIWLDLASSREALLDKATLFVNDEQDKTHFYFPQSQSVRNVDNKADWSVAFKLSDLPQGKWPEAFEINLLAAPTGDPVRSVVSVYLNDNLLVSDFMRSDGQFERITARIPQYSIAANNYLKVEVRRRCDGNDCKSGKQSYPVQVLPSSYLALGERSQFTQFFMLPPALAHDADIVLPSKYLQSAPQSLNFVNSILASLSTRTLGVSVLFTDKAEFVPRRAFVGFEVSPNVQKGLVKSNNDQLIVRNASGKVVFDGTADGSLATVQLVQAANLTGVVVLPVGMTLPHFSEPLFIAQGDFAVLDEHGVKLALNLADPENQLQLDQQNRETEFFISRNRSWFIALALLFLCVASVFGLRYFFQRSAVSEGIKNDY